MVLRLVWRDCFSILFDFLSVFCLDGKRVMVWYMGMDIWIYRCSICKAALNAMMISLLISQYNNNDKNIFKQVSFPFAPR